MCIYIYIHTHIPTCIHIYLLGGPGRRCRRRRRRCPPKGAQGRRLPAPLGGARASCVRSPYSCQRVLNDASACIVLYIVLYVIVLYNVIVDYIIVI